MKRTRRHWTPRFGILALMILSMGLSFSKLEAQSTQDPLTLQQAVGLALENNNLVKAARFGISAAESRIRFAYSGYLPKVNFDHNAMRGDNPVYVFGSLLTQRRFTAADFALSQLNVPSPLSNFQNKFSFTQSLFDGGRVRKGVKLSRLGKDISEKDLDRTRSDLIFRVVKAYYQALLSHEMVRVAEEAVKSAKADLEKAQASFTAGLAVESDLLSVKVHLAGQEEELLKARSQMMLAASNLNFEMGEPLEQLHELVKPLKSLSSEALDLGELQKQALQLRPDSQQARLATESSEVASQSAKSQFWPMISAFGSWETDNRTFWGHSGNNWLVGVNVHVNLFNGRADQAKLEESRFEQRRQGALEQHLTHAIRLQVQQAYLDYETSCQRIAVSEQAAAQAEESLRIIRNRYQAGLTTITDLLRAETALVGARTNQLRALFDQRISRANLELQSGRLTADSKIILE